MRRLFPLVILCLTFLASTAQQYTTIDQISAGWTKKTITGVKNGNILTLVTAFNKTWHTRPATDLLKHPVTQNDGNEYNIVVDRPNGYVSANELGDDGESFSACVWKRSNGHKLFAYVFQRMIGVSVHQIILFYDYNPTKQTLTPEENELTRYVASYDHPNGAGGLVLTYQLPQHGKDVVVHEYLMNWYSAIEHVYRWDGMNHHFSKVNIEKADVLHQLYTERYGKDAAFCKYMLCDVDEDGDPELWLSSDNDEDQAVYSLMRGDIRMIASKYHESHHLLPAITPQFCPLFATPD